LARKGGDVTSIYQSDYQIMCRMLREYRKQAGLSQEEVGASLGMTHSQVGKVERGERRVDLLELQAFCKTVGVSLVDFVVEMENRQTQAVKVNGSSG
jgi:transcriptional regulator with XRE-family HTH domain